MTTTSCKKGDQGPQGDSAMANVIYSDWLSADISQWGTPSATDTLRWLTVFESKQITADIINKGEVHVYFNLGTAAEPYVFPLPYATGATYIRPALFVGGIEVWANTLSAITGQNGAGIGTYRYVIIPGGVKASARTEGGSSPVDFNDYNAVKAYYNIKD
ncbi:hypothetical protein GCM10011379_12370 [Filimonas zeae]|uniref:Uncharacterized protein n=2 Tax=Filimonas zeae TaxID=1737353 RepID=A0A917IRN8_9BACT|nr:hypothetical protein GCM10011379_12370 [Filimonas zeae]